MERLSGIIAAVPTPLREDRAIDTQRLVDWCRRALQSGCDGINLLGTTGEATSFTVDQRLETMRAIAASGLDLSRFMVGTGAAALGDAVCLTAAARDLGFSGALLLPPFYYKGIDDGSVVAFVTAVVEGAGEDGLRLYLYNFPALSGVLYSSDAIRRIHARFPETLLGIKDSSGDMAYAAAVAAQCPIDVFPSAEGALARMAELRFAGCISATANITAPVCARALKASGGARDEGIARAAAIRAALSHAPTVPAVKWAVADLTGDPAWNRLMPPLRPVTEEEAGKIRDALAMTDYALLRN